MPTAESSEKTEFLTQSTGVSAEDRLQERSVDPFISELTGIIEKYGEKAYEKGMQNGTKISQIGTVLAMAKRGFAAKLIANLVELSVTEVEDIIQAFTKAGNKSAAELNRTFILTMTEYGHPAEVIADVFNCSVAEAEELISQIAASRTSYASASA